MPHRRRNSEFLPGYSSFVHYYQVNRHLYVQNEELADTSSHNPRISIGLEEIDAEHGQLPSANANSGNSEWLAEERQPDPNEDNTLRNGLDTQSATLDGIPEKLDSNLEDVAINENHRQEVGETSNLVGNTPFLHQHIRRRLTPANEQEYAPSSLDSLSGRGSFIAPVFLSSGDSAWGEEENSENVFAADNVTGGFENRLSGSNNLSSNPLGFPPTNPAGAYRERLSSIIDESLIRFTNLISEQQNGNYRLPSVGDGQSRFRSLRDPRLLRAVGLDAAAPSFLPGSAQSVVSNFQAAWYQQQFQQLLSARGAAFHYENGWIVPGPAVNEEDPYVVHDMHVFGPAVNEEDPYVVHNMHEDMRLDVDNMSYEELLALGEDIGNVSTGLSEDAILAVVGRHRYQSIELESVAEALCSICQEEYVEEEELGKLACGHEFHFDCIKQWLLEKNSCPMCKKSAMAT